MRFEEIVPRLFDDISEAIPLWDDEDVIAAIANGALESAGFQTLQEIAPSVQGSRGGYGYWQWTGPRRRTFEAWCAHKGLRPSSYEANVGFFIYEVKTTEKATINKVRRAKTLRDKIIAFEAAYERAGVKAHDKRIKWGEKVLSIIENRDARKPKPPEMVEAEKSVKPKTVGQSTTIWAQAGAIITTLGGSLAGALGALDWKVVAVVMTGVVACVAIYTVSERIMHINRDGV